VGATKGLGWGSFGPHRRGWKKGDVAQKNQSKHWPNAKKHANRYSQCNCLTVGDRTGETFVGASASRRGGVEGGVKMWGRWRSGGTRDRQTDVFNEPG